MRPPSARYFHSDENLHVHANGHPEQRSLQGPLRATEEKWKAGKGSVNRRGGEASSPSRRHDQSG